VGGTATSGTTCEDYSPSPPAPLPAGGAASRASHSSQSRNPGRTGRGGRTRSQVWRWHFLTFSLATARWNFFGSSAILILDRQKFVWTESAYRWAVEQARHEVP